MDQVEQYIRQRYAKLKEKLPVHIDYDYIDSLLSILDNYMGNSDVVDNTIVEIDYILDDIEDEISVIKEE